MLPCTRFPTRRLRFGPSNNRTARTPPSDVAGSMHNAASESGAATHHGHAVLGLPQMVQKAKLSDAGARFAPTAKESGRGDWAHNAITQGFERGINFQRSADRACEKVKGVKDPEGRGNHGCRAAGPENAAPRTSARSRILVDTRSRSRDGLVGSSYTSTTS